MITFISIITTPPLKTVTEVQENRQVDIFKQFKEPRLDTASPDVAELAKALAKELASQPSC